MLEGHARLDVVPAFHVRHVRTHAHVRQRAVLRNRLALLQRAEIVKRVAARIEIVMIAPAKSADCEHRRSADQVLPARREIERFDLRPLIARAQRIPRQRIYQERVRRVAIESQSRRAQVQLRVERIRILEPRPRETRVEVNGVRLARLKIHAVEDILLVPFRVHCLELGRIEKPPGIQAIY